MKDKYFKKIAAASLCFFALSFACHIPAVAAPKTIQIYIDNYELHIPAEFGVPFYDAAERLQIPMRFIVESCGYSVQWNESAKTATIATTAGNVAITLGSDKLITPAGTVKMDTAAMTKGERTYIPLRFALETLGFDVKWTSEASVDTVKITGDIGATAVRTPMNAAQISKAASPSVFYTEVFQSPSDYKENFPFASGSGFFITSDGLAVTNYHVIEGTSNAVIHPLDGKAYNVIDILYYNAERDIAVIRVNRTAIGSTAPTTFPYLRMGIPSAVGNGDKVYAIGSPLGLQNSISDGIVSNKNRILDDPKNPFIQITAPISHGSSGGALLNEYGEVIGVTSASLVDGQNLNLAAPLDVVFSCDWKKQGVTLLDAQKGEFYTTLFADSSSRPQRHEDPNPAYYAVNSIVSGDSFVGTFSTCYDTDYYCFYTPVPVTLSAFVFGMRDDDLDSIYDNAWIQKTGQSYENYVLSSINMVLETTSSSDRTPSTLKYLMSGKPFYSFDDLQLQPGLYYLVVSQDIESSIPWENRNYIIHLDLSFPK